ncbi:hypothetical protein P692DRAFT_20842477 [Suillus brevipes Sb2]|nr:hypothetical protein P692DRAFT_20842477 [Suillus brevipes Sb2]
MGLHSTLRSSSMGTSLSLPLSGCNLCEARRRLTGALHSSVGSEEQRFNAPMSSSSRSKGAATSHASSEDVA